MNVLRRTDSWSNLHGKNKFGCVDVLDENRFGLVKSWVLKSVR